MREAAIVATARTGGARAHRGAFNDADAPALTAYAVNAELGAHRSTTINGEIFSTSSGKVARVAFVVGDGWFDPDHGPERLRDHVDRIRALDGYSDLNCSADELALIPPLFGAP